MSEGVDVPGHLRHVVEGLLQPPQSHSHLVNEVLIVHVCLIRHAPSSINELDLPIGYNGFHLLFLPIGGLVPPTVEKSHLDDGKLVLGVFREFADNGVNSVLDSCELGAHVSTIKVVVNCLEPPDIVVGVGNEVDGEGSI